MSGNSSAETFEMGFTSDLIPVEESKLNKSYIPTRKCLQEKRVRILYYVVIAVSILLFTVGWFYWTTQVNQKGQRLDDEILKLNIKVDELEEERETNMNAMESTVNQMKEEIVSLTSNILTYTVEQKKTASVQNQTIRDITRNKEDINMISSTLKNKTDQIKLEKIMGNIRNLQSTMDIFKTLFKRRDNLTDEEINEAFTDGETKNKARKQKLLKYMRDITNSKTISGVYVTYSNTYMYNNTLNGNKGLELILNITGVMPGIINTPMPSNLADATVWNSFTDEVISNWNNQNLVRINWWAGSPFQTMTEFGYNTTVKESKWTDLVKDDGKLNLIWKGQLDLIVPHLRKLESAGVVTIFEIFYWMNYNVGFWRGRPGVNGTAKLYQLTHDYLTNHHNLRSLLWSLPLDSDVMDGFEQFWPGDDYVDVVSVDMEEKMELSTSVYQRLINLVGNKPISLERMEKVPSISQFTAQPGWTWFTLLDSWSPSKYSSDYNKTKATFNSPSVINRGNIEFFDDTV